MSDQSEGIHGRRIRQGKGHESIRREALQDTRISFKAQGILTYLLSLPDNWKTNAERLGMTRPGKEGQHAVRSGLQELEEAGYLVRKRTHLGAGKWRWIWMYSDDPESLAKQQEETEVGFSTLSFPPGGPPPGGPPSGGKSSDIKDLGSRGSRGKDLEEENLKDMVNADAPTDHDDPQASLFDEDPPPTSSEPGLGSRSKPKTARKTIRWDGPPPNDQDLEKLWAAFWQMYPRKVKRIAARAAWEKAISQVDPRHLVDAAAQYAQQQNDPMYRQFTMHPTTWLNQGCWDDEPAQPRSNGHHNGSARSGYVPYQDPEDPSVYEEAIQ